MTIYDGQKRCDKCEHHRPLYGALLCCVGTVPRSASLAREGACGPDGFMWRPIQPNSEHHRRVFDEPV